MNAVYGLFKTIHKKVDKNAVGNYNFLEIPGIYIEKGRIVFMKKVHNLLFIMMIISIMNCQGCACEAISENTMIFIPDQCIKLKLPEMPDFITLKTRTESVPMTDLDGNTFYQVEKKKDENGETFIDFRYDDAGNRIPVHGIVEDAIISLQYSKKPDWASVIWWDGWENLDVNQEGYAETTMEGHKYQPGIWEGSSPINIVTEKPEWSDYAFMAGVGPVTCEYGRRGTVNYVEYTVEQDYFKTGMEGAVTVIRWEPVSIKNTSEENYVKYETTTTVWFVTSVTATYPAGNPITKVKAEYRNDKKNTLSSYEITYAVNENESYAITYMPNTATIFEEHNYGLFLPDKSDLPSTIFYTNDPNTWEEYPSGAYWHHYTEDEPIYGEYTVNGVTYVSGSGSNLNKWYTAGHGTLLKRNGLRGVTSFTSPRVR